MCLDKVKKKTIVIIFKLCQVDDTNTNVSLWTIQTRFVLSRPGKTNATQPWAEAASFSHTGLTTFLYLRLQIIWNQFNTLVFPMIFFSKNDRNLSQTPGNIFYRRRQTVWHARFSLLTSFNYSEAAVNVSWLCYLVCWFPFLNGCLKWKAGHLHFIKPSQKWKFVDMLRADLRTWLLLLPSVLLNIGQKTWLL